MMRTISTFSLLLVTGIAVSAQQAPDHCVTPIWHIDILADLRSARNTRSPKLIDNTRAGILAADGDSLLVYSVDSQQSQLSSRELTAGPAANELNMWIVDAVRGDVHKHLTLPARAHDTSVHFAAGGWVIKRGGDLQFYSRDLEQLAALGIAESGNGDATIVSNSPNGEVLLVNRYNKWRSHFDLLDGRTFRVLRSWDESPPLRRQYSISTTNIAAADFNQQNVLVAHLGWTRWTKLMSKKTLGCVAAPTFLSDRLLVNGCNGTVFSTDEKIIMSPAMKKWDQVDDKIAASRDGRVFAVSVQHTKGHDFWDVGDVQVTGVDLEVFDVDNRTKLTDVSVTPLPRADYDFALSPDGSSLAVLKDRTVTMFCIQRSPKQKEPK